jgi:hypothetical protein
MIEMMEIAFFLTLQSFNFYSLAYGLSYIKNAIQEAKKD